MDNKNSNTAGTNRAETSKDLEKAFMGNFGGTWHKTAKKTFEADRCEGTKNVSKVAEVTSSVVKRLGLSSAKSSTLRNIKLGSNAFSDNDMVKFFKENKYKFSKLPKSFKSMDDVRISLTSETGKDVYLLSLPDLHLGVLVPEWSNTSYLLNKWGIKKSHTDLSDIDFIELFDNANVSMKVRITGDFSSTCSGFIDTCKSKGITSLLLTYAYQWNNHLPAGLTFELLTNDNENLIDFDVADLSDLPVILSALLDNGISKDTINLTVKEFLDSLSSDKNTSTLNSNTSNFSGVAYADGTKLSATEVGYLQDTYEVVKLVFNEETVGYRFIGKKNKLDIDINTAQSVGLSSLKVRKKLTLVEHNGLLVSEGEIKYGNLVIDISNNLSLSKKLLELILKK